MGKKLNFRRAEQFAQRRGAVSHPLRVVPATTPTPEQQWLALSAEIERDESSARRNRAARQAIKPGIMSVMKVWGASDEQVTAALGGLA